jgi:hypothetical protein
MSVLNVHHHIPLPLDAVYPLDTMAANAIRAAAQLGDWFTMVRPCRRSSGRSACLVARFSSLGDSRVSLRELLQGLHATTIWVGSEVIAPLPLV